MHTPCIHLHASLSALTVYNSPASKCLACLAFATFATVFDCCPLGRPPHFVHVTTGDLRSNCGVQRENGPLLQGPCIYCTSVCVAPVHPLTTHYNKFNNMRSINRTAWPPFGHHLLGIHLVSLVVDWCILLSRKANAVAFKPKNGHTKAIII